MADPITEYTARDYSAVDKQIEQIAQREQVVTQRLKLANLRRALVLAIAGLLAFGLFLILAAWAYRIAFKPEVRVIETTKVVEKIVPKIIETQVVVEKAGPPQNIIIQTPEGSRWHHRSISKALWNRHLRVSSWYQINLKLCRTNT